MKKRSFGFALFLLVCLFPPMIAAAQTVNIPDSSLRAAIATTLGKASGDSITAGEMATLTYFEAKNANIRTLTGLESATSLLYLFLGSNSISNLTPLTDLTNLQFLDLENNSVSDLSPVTGLTNLIFLGLRNNSVSDLSPLVENTGLGGGSAVNVEGNPLNQLSINTHIPALQRRGVEVLLNRRTSTPSISTPTLDTLTPTTDTQTSTRLVIILGDGQYGLPGEPLAYPFVVEVRDENGDPLEGVRMTFTVLTGGGSMDPQRAPTGPNGRVESTLTLGSRTGANTVEVRTAGISETVTFTATASTAPPMTPLLLGEPTTSMRISGDDQRGVPGEVLAYPFVVEVRNENGDPLIWTTVRFAALIGGGSLNHEITITDVNGRAESILTLGTDIGTNKVQVNVKGISQVLVFNAEALAPPMPTTLLSVSGDNQNGTTDETLTNPFVVEVRDQYDAPLEGVKVTFAVSGGGGSLSHEMGRTDANGRAESTLTLGNDSGTNTVEVSVEGVSQTVTFTAETIARMPTTLQSISGDNQNGVAGEVLMSPFVAEIRDQGSTPMEGVTVTFAVSAGGGSLNPEMGLTDANGWVESTLTLGNDPGEYTVEVSVEGITETVTFNAVAKLLEFNLSVPSGISLIHIPLKVRAVDGVVGSIESIADLYDALGGAETVNFLITYDAENQDWLGYFGPSDEGTSADKGLTDDKGIIASMKAPVSVRLGGDALGADGMAAITLHQGANLVGLPLRDSRITRVSDLFGLEGIRGNVPVIVVSDNGEFKAAGRAGDAGDIPVTGGGAFFLITMEATTVPISGEAWTNVSETAAAPPIAITRIKGGDATPVLALTGSIVDKGTGINQTGIRVILKNLSTGREAAAVIADDGAGYRLTIVDIETGQAAQIGDILEISAISPDASIGVQPLRYTVTAEDVKRSRIQLPALVLQEIPAETELLRNYPNPFNPETWIPYRLAEEAFVTLTIYDGSGQVVRKLNVGHQVAAVYESRSKAIYWDGRNEVGERVASGVYFYHLSAGSYSATRKMVILK